MKKPLLCLLLLSSVVTAEDLNVLTSSQREASNYYKHLQAEAYTLLNTRQNNLNTLTTAKAVKEYQDNLRGKFLKALGGFPKRTDLNAKIVKRTELKEYTIENIIFESQPNHHVTGNMYLPHGDGPFPVGVVSSGHSRTAKLADYNQRFGIRMACSEAWMALGPSLSLAILCA